MSDKTGIEWTEATWNPTIGCRRVSEGCRNCYAEPQARRIVAMQRAFGNTSPYEDVVRMDAAGVPLPLWNGQAVALTDRLDQPLKWTKPRLIFVNSMSDLFHEDVDFGFIETVFGVMSASPRHTYQLLTKRPGRMAEYFKWQAERFESFWSGDHHMRKAWPLPNVWIGVSVEDQATADERIPLLLECPAAVRWVSYEPALGPVRFFDEWLLGRFLECPDETQDEENDPCNGCAGYSLPGGDYCGAIRGPHLDWIVVGGESGPGARPFDLAWARSTIAQCRDAGVACFVKQLGAMPYESYSGPLIEQSADSIMRHGEYDPEEPEYRLRDRKGGDPTEWPEDLRVRQWPEVGAA